MGNMVKNENDPLTPYSEALCTVSGVEDVGGEVGGGVGAGDVGGQA